MSLVQPLLQAVERACTLPTTCAHDSHGNYAVDLGIGHGMRLPKRMRPARWHEEALRSLQQLAVWLVSTDIVCKGIVCKGKLSGALPELARRLRGGASTRRQLAEQAGTAIERTLRRKSMVYVHQTRTDAGHHDGRIALQFTLRGSGLLSSPASLACPRLQDAGASVLATWLTHTPPELWGGGYADLWAELTTAAKARHDDLALMPPDAPERYARLPQGASYRLLHVSVADLASTPAEDPRAEFISSVHDALQLLQAHGATHVPVSVALTLPCELAYERFDLAKLQGRRYAELMRCVPAEIPATASKRMIRTESDYKDARSEHAFHVVTELRDEAERGCAAAFGYLSHVKAIMDLRRKRCVCACPPDSPAIAESLAPAA